MTSADLADLAEVAWRARENARILGKTKVGCAVLESDGRLFAGCNVEHKFRSHDIHAEVNAIGNMVASGGRTIRAVVVVAERDRFTPCGGCMDWIFEFGGPGCIVAYQRKRGGTMTSYLASDLMPHYPR